MAGEKAEYYGENHLKSYRWRNQEKSVFGKLKKIEIIDMVLRFYLLFLLFVVAQLSHLAELS